MPTIRVSDEVFNELQRRAEPLVDTPDTVLRKALGLTATLVSGKTGRLLPLLRTGKLAAGDQLVWHRKRAGKIHRATVLSNGSMQLEDGRTAHSPSGACATLADNKSYDGWEEWRRDSDQTRLTDLR
ncbi:restriction system modified-DNA reader domain-containing protein [Amycolatopsis sp. NPDC003676]